MLFLVLFAILLVFISRVLFRPRDYWKKRGVLEEKPCPFFGNFASAIFQKQSIIELVDDIYKKYPDKRYVGLYSFSVPTLLLKDPELIKQIGVKDFEAFPEHRMVASEENDPIWANNLFAMKGDEKWKDVRAIVSPTFTSSKLKAMFGFITDCAKQFTDHFADNGDIVKLDLLDAFSKVTNDIIASTAFGVSCNSLKTPDNEIYLMGKSVSDISGLKGLKFFVAAVSPVLVNLFKIRLIDALTTDFFRKIIKDTIQIRKEKGIVRPDMVHLMTEARKSRLNEIKNGEKHVKTEITDDLITAQAVLFFTAGFDTTSRAMCFTTYELALHPDVQEKLREEVDCTWKICNRQLTYESLLGMKYMDMVVSESLRKWPPFAMADRKLTKSCTIDATLPGEEPLKLTGDVSCNIPIYSMHRDPKNFPDPEKFDPERFSDENRHKIVPFTYLPFGIGPRSCIGSRFALLEMKTILFYLLCEFEVVAIEETQIPLKLSKSNFNPVADGGFWLGLKPRRHSSS